MCPSQNIRGQFNNNKPWYIILLCKFNSNLNAVKTNVTAHKNQTNFYFVTNIEKTQ
jgi:hypothetical protein